MQGTIRKTIALLLILAAGLCAATAQDLTVKITKTDNSEVTKTAQASLEAALSGTELNTVASLEVTGGDFVAADWLWLRSNKSSLYKMTGFTITNGANSVADIPNTGQYGGAYFNTSVKTLYVAKVLNIGNYAFKDTRLTDVSFPDALSTGTMLFRDCYTLVNVSMPKVEVLGNQTFFGTTITTISLPALVTAGELAFRECKQLTTVDLPVLSTLGYQTFYDCIALTALNLPELTTIGDGAFSGCTALASVDFPKLINVKSLGGSTALQSANLPLAQRIEASAFYGCVALTDISMPNVTQIRDNAFNGCTSLSSITVPKLSSIGQNAFNGCSKLAVLHLGATPPTANSNSFAGYPTPRFLQLVNESGTPLTDPELTTARTAYKAANDGNTADDLWFGWEVDKDIYKVSLFDPIANGSLTIDYENCAAGTKVTIAVNPDAGYRLKTGSLNVYKTDAPTTTMELDGHSFTMPAYAVTVTAEFEANNLQLTLNGSISKSGVSLEDALQGVTLSTVSSLEITGGSFNTTDWLWLLNNRNSLYNISSFTITGGVSHVSDIPNSTESYFYTSLKSISVAGLVNIGNRAFYYSKLTSATFPDVKTIGNEAFYKSESLATLHIPAVETIGSSAFNICKALKSIDLQHLILIGNYSFSSCSGLETVNLPNVVEVGSGAFSNCTSLTQIELPSVVIGNSTVFSSCTALSSATLPKVKEIGERMFDGCNNLTSVTAPVVESISSGNAFKNCSSLATLMFGATPPTAHIYAFTGCPEVRFMVPVNVNGERLSGTELDNALLAYKAVNDGNTSDDKWYGWTLSANLHSVEAEASIQNGRVRITPIFCTTGTTVTLTAIPDQDYKLKSLTAYKKGDSNATIAISGSTFTMPDYDVMVKAEFEQNNLLVTVNGTDNRNGVSLSAALSGLALNTITSLEITGGDFVATDWLWLKANNGSLYQLASFTITNAVNSVADIPNSDYTQPRYFSSSLKNVSVAKLNRIGHSAFIYGKLTDASFPDATEVGDNAFRECQQLVNISLPKATTLGKYAFFKCKALTTISLPSVVSTDWCVFQECTTLASVDMPALTTLGYQTFIDCIALTGLNLPELITIGDGVFSGCTALTSVDFPKVINVKSLGGCTALRIANLPLAEKIENYAFSGCTALTDISIPKVTQIGDNAFNGCTALSSITVPKLSSIAQNAFNGCSRLANLHLGATPPTANSNSFTGCPTPRFLQLVDVNGTPLTDPELTTARNAYKAKDDGDTTDDLWFGWEVDKDLYEIIQDPAMSNGSLVPSIIFCPAGVTVSITVQPNAGYRMVAGSLQAYKTGESTVTVEVDALSFTMPAYAVTITAEFEANNLQLTLNGSTAKNGVSLEHALQDVVLNTISSLEITGGNFNVDDWQWLQNNRAQLSAITSFTITNGANNVDNIPNSTQGYFGGSLKSISVAKLQRIGNNAFNASNLTSASFPQATEVGTQAFYHSSALSSITLPEAISIGVYAFYSCTALAGIELPKATTVENSAFYGCTALTSASLPNVTTVKGSTFNACNLLENVQVPKATSIGSSAFLNCTKLPSISLPVVSEIQGNAFYACAALATMQVGATPPAVGTDAFGAGAASRKLVFVNNEGTPLEGEALTAARTTYKAVDDGDTTDKKWYGWDVDPMPPTSVPTGAYQATTLYPNPAREILHIEGLTQSAKVQIFNSVGALVFQQTAYPNKSLNINELNAGIYLVKIDDHAPLRLIVNK